MAHSLLSSLGWVSVVLGLTLLGTAVVQTMVPRSAGTGLHDPVLLIVPAFALLILGIWIIR